MTDESVAVLLALATLLIGGGGIATWVKLIQERRRPKLDNRAVEVATAGDSVGMSLELATTAMAQVTQFRGEVEELRARMRETDARAEAAEDMAEKAQRRAERAEHAVDAWALWADNVTMRWDEVRQHSNPPELPSVARSLMLGDYHNRRTDDRRES